MTIALPPVGPGPGPAPVPASTNTKRQLVEMAYEECSLAGYEFNLDPEEFASALRKLDALMAQWQSEGIILGYAFPPALGGSDLDESSGIPDAAVSAVSLELAFAIMPAMGKSSSAETRGRRARATSVLRSITSVIPQMGYSQGTPSGSGNRWGSGFMRVGS